MGARELDVTNVPDITADILSTGAQSSAVEAF